MVAGFGDVGKALRIAAQCRLPRDDFRNRSDCALQRRWKAMKSSPWTTPRRRRYFRHRDGQRGCDHHRSHARMKDRAIVANIGHFDSEIQVAPYAIANAQLKPQVDEIEFPDGHRILLLSEGRLVNWATPWAIQLCDERVLHQSDAGADGDLLQSGKYHKQVYTLPSIWTRRWRGCIWPRSAPS